MIPRRQTVVLGIVTVLSGVLGVIGVRTVVAPRLVAKAPREESVT